MRIFYFPSSIFHFRAEPIAQLFNGKSMANGKWQMANGQRGQSLLEVIVALVIGLIVISAFVSLGVISVRNASVSKNQANATQLATEGIEAVIAIQNTNGVVGSGRWQDIFAQSFPCSSGDIVNPQVSCNGDFILNTNVPSLTTGTNFAIQPPFSRKIRITDSSSNIKNVTSIVWWTDSQGTHKSVIARKIGKERL